MRMRLLIIILLSIVSCQLSADLVHADTLSSAKLIEKAKEFDGRTVVYEGEAMTAVQKRGEYAWINVNDGNNAIGIWCRTRDLATIKFLGGYKRKGDTLLAEGVFNRACHVHGGEMDMHAESVQITKKGYIIKEYVDTNRVVLAASFFLSTLVIVAIFRRRI